MPIYAYRCESCGHAKDVLQKVSDPLLTTCPACHAETFKKQLTAAGFQLKGSGWYVTDFRGNGGAKPETANGAATVAPKANGEGDTVKADGAKTESTTAPASSSASDATGGGGGSSGGSGSSSASV